MNLDWEAEPVPGKSMFNIELGASYAEVVNFLKRYETSEGIVQVENSAPMRLIISSDKKTVGFKTMEDGNYDWQSDLAIMFFQGAILKSITTYLNEPYSYRGLICGKIGLSHEIRELEKYFVLEYDDIDEAMYSIADDKLTGLELHGTSCNLSVDPTQKIGGMKVFVAE